MALPVSIIQRVKGISCRDGQQRVTVDVVNAIEVATWVSLGLSAASLPVTIGGFWFAIVQLRKTQSAVEATRAALEDERARVRGERLRELGAELRRLALDVQGAAEVADWTSWHRHLNSWSWIAAEAEDVLPLGVAGDEFRANLRAANQAVREAIDAAAARRQKQAAVSAQRATSATTAAYLRLRSRLTDV